MPVGQLAQGGSINAIIYAMPNLAGQAAVGERVSHSSALQEIEPAAAPKEG